MSATVNLLPLGGGEVNRYAMESRGMRVADLAPVMPRNRASEILNKKRPLTLGMIRWFHENLHLSLESLTQPYPLA